MFIANKPDNKKLKALKMKRNFIKTIKQWKNTTLILSILFTGTAERLYAQNLGPSPTANYTVGLSSDGTVYTWGRNQKGQLGDNSTTDSSTPVTVKMGAYS
ncbi:MAG: hypothetical protein IID16_08350, partial [Candidatus Marinimicrobia bacterium]|nr:hypothetical protein [Candidatus Neomarinimicrobiota bacterium]